MAKYSDQLTNELVFKTSRSGGKGGQHVNKTETKVQLLFKVSNSAVLSQLEMERIFLKLGNRINQDGFLQLSSSESRSQFSNKDLVIKQFYDLINQAITKQKNRKPTNPTKASIKRRIDAKKRNAEKKKNRRTDF